MLKSIIEALIFASGSGISLGQLKDGLKDKYRESEIKEAIAELEKTYRGESGIHLIHFRDVYQFQTNVEYGDILSDMLRPTKERELSKTLLQVLAIIAYKQPITRLEVSELRGGVSSDYVFPVLLKQNLIEPVGHRDTLGHPVLYGTTDEFLKKFGLTCLEELPEYEELLISIRNNFDKYFAKSDGLYHERNVLEDEAAAADDTEIESKLPPDPDVEDEDGEDDFPDFLDGEDVVEVD